MAARWRLRPPPVLGVRKTWGAPMPIESTPRPASVEKVTRTSVGHLSLIGCALAWTVSCGGEQRSSTGGTGSGETAETLPTSSGTNGTRDTTGGAKTGADSSSSDGAFYFDVNPGGTSTAICDAGDGEDCSCNAVDLLFVIDNSASMGVHREAINAAFPTFIAEMNSALPAGTDLHVALTRGTGFYDPGNGGGWGGPSCEATLTDGEWFPPDAGDSGENGQQGRLFEFEGQRYFEVSTDEDPAALQQWFAGALEEAISYALHSCTETVVAGSAYPFHPANAEYNVGFMRQNAVLVLFLVSDSSDLTPGNIPTSDFIDIVREAKAECGGDDCIVTSGAIQGECYGQPGNTNTRLTDFMNGFGKPPASWVSLSDPDLDFTGVLGTALANAVASTCDEVPPEG